MSNRQLVIAEQFALAELTKAQRAVNDYRDLKLHSAGGSSRAARRAATRLFLANLAVKEWRKVARSLSLKDKRAEVALAWLTYVRDRGF